MKFCANISPKKLPLVIDQARAELGFAHWRDKAASATDAGLKDFAEAAGQPSASSPYALLEAIFANSPYLTAALVADLAFARNLLEFGPEAAYDATLDQIDEPAMVDLDQAAVMACLRRAKRQAALTIAVADITGTWALEELTRRLSRFADATLRAALDLLLRQAAGKGALTLADPAAPGRACGLTIIGMGKLGAYELNYSSDIDLIVLYDPERIATDAPDELQPVLVRLTRALVRMMEERTQDGYVFRTDLRLRPDPGSTPLALSVVAAETYYESQGQNWERAAMIKARPVAGDLELGAIFLRHLRPFIWRKHLDFAAIADIQSIKRQIEAQRGGNKIAVAGQIEGHNIKLGRGGIREIEFFVQTQQLIWGGREVATRTPGTLGGLAALAELGRVTPQTAEAMATAYRFLRTLEHRLQMIDDQQTQTLPRDNAGIADLGAFMGLTEASLRETLIHHLKTVAASYADLFAHSAPLGAIGDASGALAFTGEDHHPDTLATLAELGFAEPETVSHIMRDWHRGKYRAMRSTRARELLTELTPALLAALARSVDADHALHHFDRFLANLPAGVQLFSLLHANPGLLDMIAGIMGSAPRLAEMLSRNALLLDGVLTEDFYDTPPDAAAMAASLDARLAQADDMEDILVLTRRWSNDARFQVGVQQLRNLIDIDGAGRALSDIADTAIAALTARVANSFAQAHGDFAGAEFAVLALGKLGGGEMTDSSDLDLVFIYDLPPGSDQSDGAKPLTPGIYYQRLVQRLVTALTAPTGDGKLYEVDLRLRPSGNAGPLAVSQDGFATYHQTQAWTWEHMALTRARVVTGPTALTIKIRAVLAAVLSAKRAPDKLRDDILEMRARIEQEYGTDDPWAVKHVAGGLVDCEFIAQYVALAHGHDHPEIPAKRARDILAAADKVGVITPTQAQDLIAATQLWRRIQAMLRLCLEDRDTQEAAFPEALKAALIEAETQSTFEALKVHMSETRATVSAHFAAIIGVPATDGLKTDIDGSSE